MFAPHDAIESQFEVIGFAPEHLAYLFELGVGDAEGAVQGFGGATHPTKLPVGHRAAVGINPCPDDCATTMDWDFSTHYRRRRSWSEGAQRPILNQRLRHDVDSAFVAPPMSSKGTISYTFYISLRQLLVRIWRLICGRNSLSLYSIFPP